MNFTFNIYEVFEMNTIENTTRYDLYVQINQQLCKKFERLLTDSKS